jgi:hypothetical protein
MSGSSKWSNLLTFSNHIIVCTSNLSYACYRPYSCHTTWFGHPGNILLRVNTVKLDTRFRLLLVMYKRITIFLHVTRYSLVDWYHTTLHLFPHVHILDMWPSLCSMLQHSRDSLVGRDGLRAGRPGFDSRRRQESFLYSTAFMTAVGPSYLHIQWLLGIFHRG